MTGINFSAHQNIYNTLIKELKRVYKKNNQPMPQRDDFTIYLEELSLIENLNLDFPSSRSLPYINDKLLLSYFINLKSITFKEPYVISETELNNIPNKNNLKSLTIKGSFFKSIDLTQFPNLEELTIADNLYLEELKGLDTLKKIDSFTFYNNPLYNEKQISMYATERMKDNCSLTLDTLLYCQVVSRARPHFQECRQSFRDITWVERVHTGEKIETIEYTTNAVAGIYDKITEIGNRIIPKGLNELEESYLLYKWVRANTTYDHLAADEDTFTHTIPTEVRTIDGEKVQLRMQIGKKGGSNGAFNALYESTAICEGLSRLLVMFLKTRTIECQELASFCSESPSIYAPKVNYQHIFETRGNHSIIQITIDGNTCYCDVTNEDYSPTSGRVGQTRFYRAFSELTTNWYPLRVSVPPKSEPLTKEERIKLNSLRHANNPPEDPYQKAERIIEQFNLHIIGPDITRELILKQEKNDDLFLLRFINREVKNIIDNRLLQEYKSFSAPKTTIKR